MTVFKLKRKTTLVTMNDEIENTDDDFYVTVPSEKNKEIKKNLDSNHFQLFLVAFIYQIHNYSFRAKRIGSAIPKHM